MLPGAVSTALLTSRSTPPHSASTTVDRGHAGRHGRAGRPPARGTAVRRPGRLRRSPPGCPAAGGPPPCRSRPDPRPGAPSGRSRPRPTRRRPGPVRWPGRCRGCRRSPAPGGPSARAVHRPDPYPRRGLVVRPGRGVDAARAAARTAARCARRTRPTAPPPSSSQGRVVRRSVSSSSRWRRATPSAVTVPVRRQSLRRQGGLQPDSRASGEVPRDRASQSSS